MSLTGEQPTRSAHDLACARTSFASGAVWVTRQRWCGLVVCDKPFCMERVPLSLWAQP